MTTTTQPQDPSLTQMLSDALIAGMGKAALIDDRPAFERGAREYTLPDWWFMQQAKVGGVGGLTGLAGGPVGVALEAADMAFLFSTAGRACFGIGAIINRRPIDYETDLNSILAIWSGTAQAVSTDAANVLLQKSAVKVAVALTAAPISAAAAKMGIKVISKVGFKSGGKLAAKAAAKATAKLGAKMVTKVSTKWIPLLGGAVSAGINVWVIRGLLEAAEEYYRGDILVFAEDV